MAGDSALTAISAVKNNKALITAAKAASTTGDLYLDVSDMDGSKVIFIVSSTAAASLLVKDGAQYSAGEVGDLTIATTGNTMYVVGPLETARFKDSDGYINLRRSTGDTTAVSARAVLLP